MHECTLNASRYIKYIKILPEVVSTNHQILPLPALTIVITNNHQHSALFLHTKAARNQHKNTTPPDSTQDSWCRITACSICSEVRPNFSSTWTNLTDLDKWWSKVVFAGKNPPKNLKKKGRFVSLLLFQPPPAKQKGLVYIRCNPWCYHLMCIWKCWQLKNVFLHPTSTLEVFHGLVVFCFSFFHKAKKAKDEQNKHEIFWEKKVGDNSIDVTLRKKSVIILLM